MVVEGRRWVERFLEEGEEKEGGNHGREDVNDKIKKGEGTGQKISE